ncbi:ABC transporter substrate-binding protein [Alcaligenes sp. GCM10023179]|uniref:ABC transporter substrate-binding protein n=1 Tax=Alcaligenes sp. GCM10023179 TaxID=3252633 RepID=UPI00361A856D
MNILRHLLLSLTLLLPLGVQAQPIEVTDAMGRTVTLPGPAKRIVLTQARHFPVLALVHPEPANLIAGWSDEFKTSFSNEYETYLKRYPQLASIPIVGRHTADTFSIEQALALRPDLVVLTAAFAGLTPGQDTRDSALIQRLTAAKVPVIVIDFFVNPLENTVPSLRALGYAVGEKERTDEFIQFYEEHMQGVAQRLADLPKADHPPVFVHAHAGSTDCCNSPGAGTFNDMISYAGGHNIGADVLKSSTGKLNFEYINSRAPVVYVATGTGAGKRTTSGGLAIGTGVSEDQARKSLQAIIDGNRLQALPAVRSGNSHGIWHAFNDSPLHMIFIEALAAWIHPDRFQGVSALKTLEEVNQRFLTVPMEGTYMIDLKPAP